MMNFPLNLAVGFAQPVNQVGNYVYYKSGSAGGADPSIKVKTDLGDEYILMPGQGFRLDNKAFTNLQVTNAGGVATILGSLLIADGGFFDNRVTGSVEIIDGGKNRTLAGTAFIASVMEANTAGNNTQVQLWNPAASGKNIVLPRLIASSSLSGGSIGCYVSTAALSTAQPKGKPKRIGSSFVPAAECYTRIGSPTNPADRIIYNAMQGALPTQIVFAEPIVITPGNGIVCQQALANADLQITFEWYEESNA